MAETSRNPTNLRWIRIFLFLIIVIYIFRQLAFFMGFIGPMPDASLDAMSAFLYIDPNYALGVLMAELIFPVITLVLLNNAKENSYFVLISYILSLLSIGIVLFTVLVTPIKYYALFSVLSPSLIEFPYSMILIMYLLMDSIALLLFVITVISLRKTK